MTTKAGRALLEREALNSRSFALITAEAIDDIERQKEAEVRARLAEAVKAKAHLICDCREADCPRVAAILALIQRKGAKA